MASPWIGSTDSRLPGEIDWTAEETGAERDTGGARQPAGAHPHLVGAEAARGRADADRSFEPAGFLRRAVAFLIDNTLVLLSLVGLLVLFAYATGDDGYWTGYALGFFFYVSVPAIALYWSIVFALTAWITGGRSLGKALCGIAIRSARTGTSAGFPSLLGRELFRAFLAVLLFLPLLADGLSALWSPGRRTWHDRAAGTVVVRTRSEAGSRIRPPGDD